jgi:hypothetical protein
VRQNATKRPNLLKLLKIIAVVPKAGFGAMVEIIEFFGLSVLILSTMKH